MDSQPPLAPQILSRSEILLRRTRLLAFLAFLLFCSTLFLTYRNMQLQKQISVLRSSLSPPIPLTSPTPNPKANWNTYTDSQNSISFQYPPDWILHKPTGGNGADPCCNLWLTMGKDRLLDIHIFENSYDDAIKKALLIYKKKPEPLTNYKFSGTMFTNDLDGEYILNVNGKALNFHYFFISRNYDNGAAIMASHILSTFKFTSANCTEKCPQLMPPAPNFCPNGTIVAGEINECGCPLGPTCKTNDSPGDSYTCPING